MRNFLNCLLLFAVVVRSTDVHSESELRVAAFGSCNKQFKPQPLWKDILNLRPDLWLWMGDIVYADSPLSPALPFIRYPAGPRELEQSYNTQLARSDYQQVRNATSIIGVWDDHDFGMNNGDVTYGEHRAPAQQLLLNFLDEPKASPRWTREGAYISYTYGAAPRQVKFILLDARYHLNTTSEDMLGDAQWSWLEQELRDEAPAFTFIVSGVQVLPDDKAVAEGWHRLPASRDRLLGLITKTKASGVVFLSGDIHMGEFSRLDCTDVGYPLFEMTTSGMTHAWGYNPWSPMGIAYHTVLYPGLSGHMRAPGYEHLLFGGLNFGSLDFQWCDHEAAQKEGGQDGSARCWPSVVVRLHGEGGDAVVEQKISQKHLQFGSQRDTHAVGGEFSWGRCYPTLATHPQAIYHRNAGLVLMALMTTFVLLSLVNLCLCTWRLDSKRWFGLSRRMYSGVLAALLAAVVVQQWHAAVNAPL